MALYYEAASFLTPDQLESSESLSSRVYANKTLKSQPAHIYALLSQTAKWSEILSAVIERSDILKHKRKLTPALALVLTHDLLLSKNGIAAPKGHILSQTISKHKTRLNAEFARARVKAGAADIKTWSKIVEEAHAAKSGDDDDRRHPRWVRINTLVTTSDYQFASGVFAGWKSVKTLSELRPSSPTYLVDCNIPDLVATPFGTDLTKTAAYRNGEIILQDKASCFSAYLLNPDLQDGDFIDGCSAPGNKTTHLAMLLASNGHTQTSKQKIFAVEKDRQRSQTLQKMVSVAKANTVQCLPSTDFKRLSPEDARFANVGAILLDPSCSGSGIVGRDDGEDSASFNVTLPAADSKAVLEQRGKKRKRMEECLTAKATHKPERSNDAPLQHAEDALKQRLEGLASFQLSLVKHAMQFPNARKLIYSTCSIHVQENELVVNRALSSDIARERGWRLLLRREQVDGLQKWERRGDLQAITDALSHEDQEAVMPLDDLAESCIRCQKGTDEGTMGFFVAAFVRGATAELVNEEDEWSGFSDDDD